MSMQFLKTLAISGGIVATAGCQIVVPNPVVPCSTSDECGVGEICQAGVCRNAPGDGDGDVCGNGFCEIGETATSCLADCGDFVPGDEDCGNGFCELGESDSNCPQDCEVGLPGDNVCGNNLCETGENEVNCFFDCDNQDAFICGDGFCDTGETFDCPEDCGDSDPCTPTCISNLGCDDGDPCTTDNCVPAAGQCGPVNICRNVEITCAFGQQCVNGFCEIAAQCFTNADCAIGQTCSNGECIP